MTDALHWIWAWRVQAERLVESTNAQGLGADQTERRRSYSRASLDEHLLIVVGWNLQRAIWAVSAFLPDAKPAEDHSDALRLLRNLYEHWDEQRAAFVMPQAVKARSAKEFTRKFPPRPTPGQSFTSTKTGCWDASSR